MNSSTIYWMVGAVAAVAAILTAWANVTKNRETSESGKKNTADIVDAVGKSEKRLGEKTDEGFGAISSQIDGVREAIDEKNDKHQIRLKSQYPYGYILFLGQGGGEVYRPFISGSGHVEADWNLAHIELDPADKKIVKLSLPPIAGTFGPSRKPILNTEIFELGNIEYELGTPIYVRFFGVGDKICELQILEDNGPQPVWVIGFVRR
jgi:hypothetical protein